MLAQSDWPSWLDWFPDGFDSWDAWVAIATLALASATLYLGFQARDSAKAAKRSAEVSERAFAVSIRPLLAQSATKPVVECSGNVVTAQVPLRNVGSGLAFIQGMGWVHAPVGTLQTTTTGAAVPGGEDTWLVFEIICADNAAARAVEQQLVSEPDGFTVLVRYVDATGEQPTRTQAKLLYGPDTGWRFEQVAVFDGDAERAFAVLLGRSSVTVTIGAAVEHDEALPITPRGGARPTESE